MRILFYVEPFPIRNTMTHFVDIARSALNLAGIDPSSDMRVFANQATIDKLGDVANRKATFILQPSPSDEKLFASHLVAWAEQGVDLWSQLIRGEGPGLAYEALVQRLWQRFPFDILVSWGENQAIARAARAVGALHLSMEMGCTRPPFLRSIVIDPFGTNGNSLPSQLDFDAIEAATEGRTLSAQIALGAYGENHECRAFDQPFVPLTGPLGSLMIGNGRKVAFLPLQLYDDANLLVHSPYDTLADVVRDVVPRLAQAGWYTIIKPHPDSRHRPNALVENQLAHASIATLSDHFHWIDEHSGTVANATIFNAASLIVTVNSSVGFEALYYDKPVVVLGDASYKPAGVFPTLAEATSGDYDHATYLYRIGVLRAFMLEGYLAADNVFANTTAFLQRITAVAAIAREARHDPVAIARSMYATFAPARRHQRETAMLTGPSRPGVGESRAAALPTVSPPPAAPSADATDPLVESIPAPFRDLLLTRLVTMAESDRPEEMLAFLDRTWEQPVDRRTLLLKLGCADKAFLRERYAALIPQGADPLTFYIDRGERLGLSPSPRIVLDNHIATRPGLSATPLKDLLADLVLSAANTPVGSKSSLTDDDRTAIDQARHRLGGVVAATTRRIAVVAHLFYADLVPELLDMIGRIEEPFDLIVTLPTWGTRETCRLVTERFPDAVLLPLPNRGRDIGPFLEVLPFLIDGGYEAVLKVQTKKGYYRGGRLVSGWGDTWRRTAFDDLVGNGVLSSYIIDLFTTDADVTMVGPEPFCVALADYPSQDGHRDFWLQAGLPLFEPGDVFFAGTMFWVRPAALRPLVEAGVTMESFGEETGSNDGAIAHDVERYLGVLAGRAGRMISALDVEGEGWLRNAVPATLRLDEVIGTLHEARSATLATADTGNLLW